MSKFDDLCTAQLSGAASVRKADEECANGLKAIVLAFKRYLGVPDDKFTLTAPEEQPTQGDKRDWHKLLRSTGHGSWEIDAHVKLGPATNQGSWHRVRVTAIKNANDVRLHIGGHAAPHFVEDDIQPVRQVFDKVFEDIAKKQRAGFQAKEGSSWEHPPEG